MKKQPLVSIITVNYNGKKLIGECLDSLFSMNYPKNKFEVIVVDNHSSDNSVKFIKANYKKVNIIENELNNYCQACNRGIRKAKGEFICLLNNDVKVKKDWLWELIKVMKRNNAIGAVTGKLLKEDGTIQNAGLYELPNFYWEERGAGKENKRYNTITEVDAISGACVLYRRKALGQVGLLDEDFVMFGEDVDMSFRLKKKRWKLIYVPKSVAYHKLHGSCDEKFARDFIERNRLLFIAKHYPFKLTDALLGSGHFIINEENKNSGRLFDLMPDVFMKLSTEHGQQAIKKVIKNLFGELKKIVNYENKKLEADLKNVLIDLAGTRKDREEIIKDRDHYKNNESYYIQKIYEKDEWYKQEINNLSGKLKESLDAISLKDNAAHDAEQKLHAYQKEIEALNNKIKESLETISIRENAIRDIEHQLGIRREEINNLNTKIKESLDNILLKDNTIQDVEQKLHAYQEEIARFNDRLKEKDSAIFDKEHYIDELSDKLCNLQQELDGYRSSLENLNQKLQLNNESLGEKESIILRQNQSIKETSEQLVHIQEELNNSKQEKAAIAVKLQQTLDSIVFKDSALMEQDHYIAELHNQLDNLKSDLNVRKEELNILSSRLKESLEAISLKENTIHDIERQLNVRNEEINTFNTKLKESLESGLQKDNSIRDMQRQFRVYQKEINILNNKLKKSLDAGMLKDNFIRDIKYQASVLSNKLQKSLEAISIKDNTIHDIEQKLESYQREINNLNTQFKESLDAGLLKDSTILEIERQLNDYKQEVNTLSNKLKESLDNSLIKDSVILDKEQRIAALSKELEDLQQKLTQHQGEITDLDNKLKASLELVSNKDSTLLEKDRQLQELSQNLDSLTQDLDNYKEEVSTLSNKLKESLDNSLLKDSTILDKEKRIEELSQNLDALSHELNSYKEEVSTLSNRLKESLDNGLLKDSTILDKEKRIEGLTQDLESLHNDLNAHQEEINTLSNKLKESLDNSLLKDSTILDKEKRIEELAQNLDALHNELTSHKEEISNLSYKLKESLDAGLLKDNTIIEIERQLHDYKEEVNTLSNTLKESLDKSLKLEKELSNIYNSEGFRFVLNPLWKIIWYSRLIFKFFIKKIYNFIWRTIIIFIFPFILLQLLFFLLERMVEILFGRVSNYFKKERDVVPFDKLTISVVIPNWNGIDLLKQCLRSIYEIDEFKEGKHEVLVVDDASEYEIAECIKGDFPQVRVIRNLHNKGFGRSCNLGVKNAKGELIILLNNDIMVSRDFLQPLKEHFKDENVFAVAPKLYYWDKKTFNYGMHMGRLEGGYLSLWNEAETGNGDKVSQASPTIFAVGGAMCFRKRDFLWLGGFDDIYRPNCWEDIDISYRAQKRGLKVLYEPKSLAYHKGASTLNYIRHKEIKNELLFMWKNLTDKQMLLSHLNQLPRFFYHGRHSSRPIFLIGYFWAFSYFIWALAHRFNEKKYIKFSDKKILNMSMLYYRNFKRNNYVHPDKKTVLLITPFIIYPLTSGGKLRIYNLYKRLSQKYNVILLSLIHNECEKDYIDKLKGIFTQVHAIHAKTPSSEFLFPRCYRYAYSTFLIEKLKEILETTPIDAVHIESNELLYLSKHIKYSPIIYTEHDISILSHSSSYYNHKKNSGNLLSGFVDYLKIVRYHNAIYNRIDRTIVLSKQDHLMVRAFAPHADISLVPTGVDLGRFPFREKTGRNKNLIFVGHYPHYPNEEAAAYFATRIFPLIKKEIPEVRLRLVGSDPTEAIMKLLQIEGIEVTGTVEDVNPHLQDASIFVNAFQRSAGIKGKVLEAMATGTPVVCTTQGACGIDAINGESILIADRPVDFANYVVRLLKDDDLYRKIAFNARKLVEQKYDWDNIARQLDREYQDIMGVGSQDSNVQIEKPEGAVNELKNIIDRVDNIVDLSLDYLNKNRKSVNRDNPEELHIELTHVCNSKCITCDIWDYHQRNNRAVGDELSFEEIKGLIEKSERLKAVKTVVLSGGEPFLRRDLVDICCLIADALPQASLGILTNATNTETVLSKTKEILQSSRVHSLWIGSSLDGIGQMYDKIRGMEGGFERFVRTVLRFKQELPDISFSTTFVLTPFNMEELLPCWEFADKFDLDFFAQFGVPKPARSPEVFQWQEKDYARIKEYTNQIIEKIITKNNIDLEHFYGSLAKVSDKVNILTKIYYWAHLVDFQRTGKRLAYNCNAGFKFAMFDAYGNTFFCPLLKDKTMGNIRGRDFDELWSSQEAATIRDFIDSGKCSCWLVCTVFPIVGEALSLYGDKVISSLLLEHDLDKNRLKLKGDIREALNMHMDKIDNFTDNKDLLSSVTQYVKSNLELNNEEFREKKCILKSTPPGVTIGTNFGCNANCIFCLGGDYKPFSLKLYKDYFEPRLGSMLDQSDYVSLCGMGELLLMPEIEKFLDYLNKMIPEKNKILTTNGLPLNNNIMERITKSKYSLQVSLHASNPALHEYLTGIKKGGFDIITQQIRSLVAKRKDRRSPYITLVFVANTMNIEDLPNFVELAVSLGGDCVQCNYLTIFKPSHIKLSCFFKQEVTNQMFDIATQKANELKVSLILPPRFSANEYLRSICRDPWKNVYVDTEGAVLPCCYSGEHFGELEKEDIFSIWNNAKFKRIRADLTSGNPIEMCKYCLNNRQDNVNLFNAHISFRPEVQKTIFEQTQN